MLVCFNMHIYTFAKPYVYCHGLLSLRTVRAPDISLYTGPSLAFCFLLIAPVRSAVVRVMILLEQ
jgi:hypothetical protein